MIESDINICKKINELLQQYDRIFLLKDIDNRILELMENYLRQSPLEYSYIIFEENRLRNMSNEFGFSKKEIHSIYKAYGLYEYTDRIILLHNDSNIATLVNYVQQGVLTKNEMIEAIFC